MPSLFSSPSVTIEAPPAPPAPPPPPTARALSEQEIGLLNTQRSLLERNLAIQEQAQQEAAATRAAIEKATGSSLQDLVAQEALRSRTERQAFETAVGMPYEQFVAQQAKEQMDLGALQRGLQQQIIQQAKDERDAFIRAVGITPEDAQAEESRRQLTLARGLGERFEKALSGTLPVSPGLERSLAEQRRELEASLREALGSGYALSTPGQVAMAEFDKRAEELRDAARTGAISEAEQVGFGLVPATERVRQARTSALSGAGPLTGGLQGFSGATDFQPYSARSFLATPPQLEALRSSLASDRAMDFQGRLAGYQGALQSGLSGYQGQLGYLSNLNNARLGLAGAQAQAQAGALSGALAAAGYGAGAYYGAQRTPRSNPLADWPGGNW